MQALHVVSHRLRPLPARILCGTAQLVLVALGTVACGGTPANSKDVQTTVVIEAATDINPDRAGRASPVVVRILAMRNADTFRRLPLEDLLKSELAASESWITAEREVVITPGGKVIERMVLPAESRAIGAVAGFRDEKAAVFRDVSPLPAKRKGKLRAPEEVTVMVNARSIMVTVVP